MAEKSFELGDRVKMDRRSEFFGQHKINSREYEGTIVKVPWNSTFAYGVRWDWMTSGDHYGYNNRDLLPAIQTNATQYSMLKELPEELE